MHALLLAPLLLSWRNCLKITVGSSQRHWEQDQLGRFNLGPVLLTQRWLQPI